MKLLKKASLAAAIAAAPFAAQALQPLDDATLSNTTGQAGVTIEIDIDNSGISVGEIEYTDQGSVLLQDITVSNVNNLTQTIDVDANGNLAIGMTGVTGMQVAIGDTLADTSGNSSALALRSVGGATTEVVNNIDMTLNLGQSETFIFNLEQAGNSVTFANGDTIATADLPVSAQVGSVAILSRSAIQITDMNVGAFGYTRAQADTRADSAAYGGNGDGNLNAAEQVVADNLANGSAVQIEGLEFYSLDSNGDKQAATIDQTIWAKGGSVADGGGVYIQMGQIAGTLDIDAIKMGGESIGGVKVSDINLAGMTQRIYGHN
ncbi:hypothetical protein GCM10011297_14180 [Bacterioplanes sanyensis]|uniref:DUF6160 family protein n=1 Tax=Bacterioplanes sanyensis TaxID=1249553 RepID=UPI001677338E|nr:DUF6160 family protein [Bacterioplanes sanyensis]GGY42298.1 hypothetical protein GCM10011297_14180 [Bacterioplanes sanyensis]